MTDVLIVGAGPVGLVLACLLGKQGRSVLVLEKKPARDSASNAIGVTPPSLALLGKLDVATELLQFGASIKRVHVHGQERTILGEVNFPEPILSVPQGVTEMVLEQRVRELSNVTLEYGWQFQSFDQDPEFLMALFQDASGNPRAERALFLVGCDGVHSKVRDSIDVAWKPRRFDSTFLMGDYFDETGWGDEAHLFFTSLGAVESFPLGQGKRRWIVQTSTYLDQPGSYLEDQVQERTGIALDPVTRTWQSPFGIHRWISEHYAWGRVYLAGDSAHQMSPIGGQGMNTGFADAEFLAALLEARLEKPKSKLAERWNTLYSRVRRKAGKTAAARSELSMAVGTVRGWASSPRNALLGWLLQVLRNVIPAHYAMLTIPFRNLAQAKARYPELASFKDIQ
jgi:2-polyprenyl-6-methoxyphenol hydroxylase-like FAD-dependent oxidoreductase